MQEKIFYAVHNVFRKKNFDRDQQFLGRHSLNGGPHNMDFCGPVIFHFGAFVEREGFI